MSAAQAAHSAGPGGGKYRVLLQLGEGGTATVYLAVASGPAGFNKLVVLKTLRPSVATDPDMQMAFMNEARISARLSHPNVVQVNEILEQDGLPIIVMEYLEGQALELVTRRAGARLTLPQHLHVIDRALRALEYAHDFSDFDGAKLELVHRDVSPHNVFVTYDGQVKLLDFGIAKLSESGGNTATGVIKGKLRYMAPEQILNERVDRRADIYAAGVMLWEAMTGQRMWSGLGDATIMNRVINGELPPPEPRPDAPPELAAVVAKATALDPDDRYATAAELRAELDRIGSLEKDTSEATIGTLMSEEFRAERARTRAVVRSFLADQSLTSSGERTGPVAFPKVLAHLPAAELSSTGSSTVSATPAGSGRPLMVGAFLAVLLVLGGVAWFSFANPTESNEVSRSATQPIPPAPPVEAVAAVPEASPSPVEAPAEPPDPEPALRSLVITAFPETARIYLDDVELETNPYRAQVPSGTAEHIVRVVAPGYEEGSRTLRYDQDHYVVMRLDRQRRRATPRGETSARNDCDPPYYLDDRGIKRFRPQCL